jgi:uncharacterized membrane protein
MKKTSILILIILISIANVIADPEYAQQTCGGINGMMSGYYGQGYIILGWITYILVILLIIAGIYWLFTNAKRRKQ